MSQPPAFGNRKDEAMQWEEIIVVEHLQVELRIEISEAIPNPRVHGVGIDQP